MQALRQSGREIQHYSGRAILPQNAGAMAITGLASRSLDSWVMTPEVCRSLFLQGAGESDLAVVEGHFDSHSGEHELPGGRLDTLCQWLGLPKIAVIDVRQLAACRLPNAVPGVEAILLDRVADEAELARWRTTFETLWGVPVVGALDECAAARWRVSQLAAGGRPSVDLCEELGARFAARSSMAKIAALAERPFVSGGTSNAFCRCRARGRLRVAVAYDRAFQGYFTETLELLEQGGAEVVAFSPLVDESLPEDIDLIYLGDASIEPHVAALSDNQCMLMALRSWVCCGGSVYAEAGGLAYLCDTFETADGKTYSLAGALPATARCLPTQDAPEACELQLPRDTWLGDTGTRLRGYRSAAWQISLTPTPGLTATPDQSPSLIVRRGLVGSMAQVDFAAQPELLARFFEPVRAGLRFSPSQVAL
jgi:cobyrinic acid a,c-diamide synthase